MAEGVRAGSQTDIRGLIRMHAQCSPTTVHRRFLSAVPVMTTKLAAALLCPIGGFSVVSERGEALVGVITVAPYAADSGRQPGEADAGLLVVDSWQRKGVGSALLWAAIRQAPELGFDELRLTVHPDNAAVLAMISSLGLRARVSLRDGYTQIALPLISRRAVG